MIKRLLMVIIFLALGCATSADQATTWSVPLVGPSTPSVFAGRIDDSFDALLSSHSGTTAPTYAVAGTLWYKTIDATSAEVYIFDGADWILLGDLDLTNNLFSPAIRSVFVNETNGTPTISTTYFDGTSVLSYDTWESVGPTGSGADNIWTALDSLPSDIDWIEIKIHIVASASSSSTSTFRTANLLARKNGSSTLNASAQTIGTCTSYFDAGGDSECQGIDTHKVPVSSKMFDLYKDFNTSFNSIQGLYLTLTGYGKNP